MDKDTELIWEAYDSGRRIAYHVTYKENIDSIIENGIEVRSPEDYSDEYGVYVFPSKSHAEDSIMNWLGDRLDEDKDIVLLTVDITGLDSKSDVGYEIRVIEPIEPSRVIDIAVV